MTAWQAVARCLAAWLARTSRRNPASRAGRLAGVALAITPGLGGASPATATDGGRSPAAVASSEPATESLAALLDPLFARQMADAHIPGAVFVLVQDGAVVYRKGYGAADPDRGGAVEPGTTIFRVMSVSKLVTAVAVLQLVEQGRLGLRADVNNYLSGFRVATTYPQNVTIEQLLTHTAGFDYDLDDVGTSARDASAFPTLAASLWPTTATMGSSSSPSSSPSSPLP